MRNFFRTGLAVLTLLLLAAWSTLPAEISDRVEKIGQADASAERATPGMNANSWGPIPVRSDQSNVPGHDVASVPVPQTFAQGWDVPDRRGSETPPGMAIEPQGGALKPRRVTPKDFYLNLVSPDKADLHYLIVKFTEESKVRWSSGRPYSKSGADLSQLNAYLNAHPDVKMGRESEGTSEELIDFWEMNGERNTGQDLANMNNFYVLYYPENPDPMATIQEIIKWDIVETAWYGPLAQVCCADIAPVTPNWAANQDYQEAAPLGLNNQYAWSYHPTGGPGSTSAWCFDIEVDWTEDHEDLPSDFFVYGGGDEGNAADHGDATVSIVAACNNGYGMTGGSYNVHPKAVDWYRQSGTYPNGRWVSAFNIAAGEMLVGESYWIEIHYPGPDPGYSCDTGCGNCGQFGYIAVEYWDDTFTAIQTHTANGLVVYEAAGNGQMNLDNGVYGNRFQRWFRDSGAILVGAGIPATVAGECWSNYGSRLDLSGWGDSVYASGYGGLFNPGGDIRQRYTSTFSGTSSATPIVCSAGNCLQGIAQRKYSTTLTPSQIRTSLDIGATAWTGSHDIGERPNLVNAINWIEPDLYPYQRGGWYSACVPRNAAGADGSSCPITASLTGNASATYFNVSGHNVGYTPAPGDDEGGQVYTEQYIDGSFTRWYSWPSVAANADFYYVNAGPDYVRGGRHSVQWYIDPFDAINEWVETDNAVTQQFVWSPYQLSMGGGLERSAPPLKSWGSPTYYNGDGFRATPSQWWLGVAVQPQSGNDVDLYSYADSYTSTTGFATAQAISARGSGSTDLILVNGNTVGYNPTRLFQAIRYSDGSTSDYRIEADSSTSASWYPPYTTTRYLASYEVLDVFEVHLNAGNQYFMGLRDVSNTVDLSLILYGNTGDYYSYYSYDHLAESQGLGGNEYMIFTADTTGWYAAVVLKKGYESYGVGGWYTFVFETPGTADLVQGDGKPGWDAPLIPRNAADASPASCALPAAVQGNATNYINATWLNDGTAIVPSGFDNRISLDNVQIGSWATTLLLYPWNYDQRVNSFATTIRGGRHTLTLDLDVNSEVAESNEGNNSYSVQYVWSPLNMTGDVGYLRSAPPAIGGGAYYNADGFEFDMVSNVGSGFAMLPTAAGADYDVYLYSDYSGTTAGYSDYVTGSGYVAGYPDYVIVPYRRYSTQHNWFPMVRQWNNESDNMRVEFDHTLNGGIFNAASPWSLPDPDTISTTGIWNLYEIQLNAGTTYRLACDILSGSANIELRLHRDSLDYQPRSAAIAVANANPGGGDEEIIYTPAVTDWYILVVSKSWATDTGLNAIYNLSGGPAYAQPMPVSDLVVEWWSSPAGIRLGWSHVTQDVNGNPLPSHRYVIYRNNNYGFIPTPADSIGGTTDSTYVDPNPFGILMRFYKVKVKTDPPVLGE